MALSRVLAAPIFGVMAVVQVLRYVQAWPVSINGLAVPLWGSAVAALVLATLAVLMWRDGAPRRERF